MLAIFFLLLFLSTNTVFGEVVKLPVFAHHFSEHLQENKNQSLFDFLALHYSKKIEHQHNNKHEDHDKLPFKTADIGISTMVSLLPPISKLVSIKSHELADLEMPAYKQPNYLNTFLSSIWQPPRFS